MLAIPSVLRNTKYSDPPRQSDATPTCQSSGQHHFQRQDTPFSPRGACCADSLIRLPNVIDLSTTAPLFSKEGLGEILHSAIKIPLVSPFIQ